MNRFLISVIVPVYNVKNYIEECIESVINQTIGFNNIELILVDDCSNDGSWDIITKYNEKYKNINGIRLKENTGSPGEPRNKGIKASTGEFIIFLDPDDILPSDAYEKLYYYMNKYDSDFVMGKMTSFNDEDKKESEHSTFRDYQLQKTYINTNINKNKFFLQVKTGHVIKLVKAKLIKDNKIEFEESLTNGEDKLYDITLYKVSDRFTYIPEVVYKYRVRNDEENKSMTQQDVFTSVYNDINITKIISRILDEDEICYFQVNAFRSILWKIIDEAFYEITYDKKIAMFKDLNIILKGYDEKLMKMYFNLEYPIISLINKKFYNEAIRYTNTLIARRVWYKAFLNEKNTYKEIIMLRKSLSWKITKPLRKIGKILK